jgi:tRNA A37 threonylcarbamoyladenosine modification protein TsaB
VYWGTYDAEGARETGPAVATPAAVRTWLEGEEEPPRVAVGQGAVMYRDSLGLPVLETLHPTVVSFAALAAERILAGTPSEHLTAFYLRKPDAMEPRPRLERQAQP